MRIAAAISLIGLSAIIAVGCQSAREPETGATDPVRLARILPTPAGLGLAEAVPAGSADARALARAFGDPAARGSLEASGLQRGAVREWTGPNGRRLVVAVSVWNGPQAAQLVNAAAAERVLGQPGARAWTPEEVRASRGVLSPGVKTLSLAIDQTGTFIRSDGPVPESVLIRLAELVVTTLKAGT